MDEVKEEVLDEVKDGETVAEAEPTEAKAPGMDFTPKGTLLVLTDGEKVQYQVNNLNRLELVAIAQHFAQQLNKVG